MILDQAMYKQHLTQLKDEATLHLHVETFHEQDNLEPTKTPLANTC